MAGTFYSSDERRAIDSFRKVVSQWLDENAKIPPDIPLPRRGNPLPEPLQEWTVQFRKNLGEKGWLAPNWPAQYGGGGLSVHHASIIHALRAGLGDTQFELELALISEAAM